MPEQESNPELQAAREDMLKRYREILKAQWEDSDAFRTPPRRSAYMDRKPGRQEETNRIEKECLKLGITMDELNDIRSDVIEQVRQEREK